jgi:hypothetical protein
MTLPKTIKIENVDPDVYCPAVWKEAYLQENNDGFLYKPCCYFKIPTQDHTVDRLTDTTNIFNDYNNSKYIKKLREDNLNGVKDPGCYFCTHHEETHEQPSDVFSGRQRSIQFTESNELPVTSHVTLSLGNLCNLSCAICVPWQSTSWVPLYEKGWGTTMFKYKKDTRTDVIDDPELFKSIKSMNLQGGEIFLEPRYTQFFKNFRKYRDYSELCLQIFTNGTMLPDDEFMEILNSCQEINLYFSIDDIKDRFEYQRRGAKWDKVLANMNEFKARANKNINFKFNITYSLFDIYYLPELVEFMSVHYPDFERFYSRFNSGLANCSADLMTPKVRDAVLAKAKGIPELNFLEGLILPIETNPFGEFLDYVKKYDSLTNTSYKDAHGEFYELLTNPL